MSTLDEQDDINKLLQQAEATKWTYADVKARFDAVEASTYGEWMSGWLPDYAYAHDLVLKAIRLYLPESGAVLDLGAGTGRFSKRVLETFNGCHITLVDFSVNMLE